jgi:hypothetical protein
VPLCAGTVWSWACRVLALHARVAQWEGQSKLATKHHRRLLGATEGLVETGTRTGCDTVRDGGRGRPSAELGKVAGCSRHVVLTHISLGRRRRCRLVLVGVGPGGVRHLCALVVSISGRRNPNPHGRSARWVRAATRVRTEAPHRHTLVPSQWTECVYLQEPGEIAMGASNAPALGAALARVMAGRRGWPGYSNPPW